ncbi:MAG: ATP-binding cassette domain-containing protein [Acholeplasmataceae bacterium]
MEALRLERVSKYYQSENNVSVGMKHISLSFHMGEFVAVTGESGSGKSTLLNVLSGLDKYEEGEMFIFSEETSHYQIKDFETYRRENVGFVFQNYNIIDSYTVFQNVMLALELQGFPSKERKARALKLIDQVGLTKQKNQKSSKLSGGQKQRAVIARALAKDTPIIVCDEPTGNLDQTSAEQIMSLLNDVSKDKLVIVVTHEFDLVAPYATRRIKMSDGEVVEDIQLKAHEEVSITKRDQSKKLNIFDLLKFSMRNLFAQPKRFFFMLFLMLIAISVFTIVYSNQIYGLRTTGLEQSETYPSVPNSRVLVERRDGNPLTQEDINHIQSYRDVNKVFAYGALFHNDTRFNIVTFYNNDDVMDMMNYRFNDSAHVLTSNSLLEGRLPIAMDEIVVSNYWWGIDIDQTVLLTSDRIWDWDKNSLEEAGIGYFKIVGIVDNDMETIYFSDDYLSQIYPTEPTLDQSLKMQVKQSLENSLRISINNNDVFVYDAFKEYDGYDVYLNDEELFETPLSIEVEIQAESLSQTLTMNKTLVFANGILENEFNYGYISTSVYDEIVNTLLLEVEDEYVSLPSAIASVSVENQLAGTRLIESLDTEVYKVYYPANIPGFLQEFLVFILAIVAVIILLILGLFLYAVIHAVTKNMMNARKKDFSIFRSVGAHESTLSILVIIEQILLSMIGLILSVLILNAIVSFVPNHGLTIEYMRISDYIILVFAITLLGLWLGLRFNKKVFHQTVIQSLTSGGE